MQASPPHGGIASRPAAFVAAGVAASWGGLLGLIHHMGSSGPPGDEFGSIAFGAAFVSAAIVALIGILRRRPWLTTFAGFALVPMSLVTFNPIAFPLLPAAAVLLANGLTRSRTWPKFGVAHAAVAGLLPVAALAVLLFHEDPARWETSAGSAGSSDIITGTEAAWSLSLAGSAMVLGVLASVGSRGEEAA